MEDRNVLTIDEGLINQKCKGCKKVSKRKLMIGIKKI